MRIVTCLLMILLAGKEFPGARQLITTNFSGILIIHTTVTAVPLTKGIEIGTAGAAEWIRDRQVAFMNFYSYHAEVIIHVDGFCSGLDFEWNQY